MFRRVFMAQKVSLPDGNQAAAAITYKSNIFDNKK
jgi:hypothetical protein